MKISPIRAEAASIVLCRFDKIICFLKNNFDELFFKLYIT